MVEGVNRACKQADIKEPRGSCSVDLTENEMTDNKHLLKESSNFDKFRGHIIACQPLAPPINRIAIDAVIKEWNKRGEKPFAKWFFENHVQQNFGWMDGTWGFRIPKYTQALERRHQEVNKDILEALREENPAARLPAPVTDVIRAIFYKCLRRWSTNAPSFERFTEARPADYRQARHFKGESLLLEISEGVYCFTQKIPIGPLYRMTKKEAKDVIELHQKKSWTWKQFKRGIPRHMLPPNSSSLACRRR